MNEVDFLTKLAILKETLVLDKSGYDDLAYEQMLNEFLDELNLDN